MTKKTGRTTAISTVAVPARLARRRRIVDDFLVEGNIVISKTKLWQSENV